jgi:RNA polymerase sigma-70 factor (ECF subfamily)
MKTEPGRDRQANWSGMDPTDEQLVQAAARGDRGAYAQFVNRHCAALLRFCLVRAPDAYAAEDAAQEALMRLFSQVRSGKVPGQPLAYLLGVARLCCHEQRRESLRRPAELAGEEPDPDVAHPWAAVELRELLDALSDDERTLIYMKHTEGLKCREIAERLGKPLGTVTAAMARTYAKLRGIAGIGEQD